MSGSHSQHERAYLLQLTKIEESLLQVHEKKSELLLKNRQAPPNRRERRDPRLPLGRQETTLLYVREKDPDYPLLPFQKMEESIRSRREDGAHSNLQKEKSDLQTSLRKRSGKSPSSWSTTGRESRSPKLVEVKEESLFVAESSFTSW